MSNEPTKLRVLVRECDDGALEAQMLDLDIAARARYEADLVEELRHAIVMEHRIAKRYGVTPFVSLLETVPSEHRSCWSDEGTTTLGVLELPGEIMEDLALALRAPIASFTITEYKKAA